MRTLFPLAVVGLIVLALPGVGVFAADLLGYGAGVNTYLEARFGVSHRVALGLPAAAALFAVPPILILLYFLRLKRKPVAVPSTFLWKKSVEDLHVNRLMQWLRRNVLLLLQLLAVLALIYGVLGPRLHGSLTGGRHYILVIDNSASMSATDVPPTRLDWAKAEARKEIDAATDADFGMVIAFSDGAEIRQSYTANRAELRRAVDAIRPTVRLTRLDEALSLAASLANPERSTENEVAAPRNPEPGKERQYVAAEGMSADVHLYSDGKFPPVPDFALANLNLTYHVPPVRRESAGVSVGDSGKTQPGTADGSALLTDTDTATATDTASDNIAVTRFEAERDPDDPATVVCRATVRNYRSTPVVPRVRLEVLTADGRLTASYEEDRRRGETPDERTARLTIPPRGERSDVVVTIPDVSDDADLVLHLKLDGAADALPLDDEAWVVLGIVRKSRVLVVGPSNRRLRDFLDSPAAKKLSDVTYLDPAALADPAAYLTPARDGRFDLVIFDRCGPDSADAMPAANTLFVGHPPPPFAPPGKPAADGWTATKLVAGPLVRGWDAKHPAMQNLRALDEIDIAEGFELPELPPRTRRLIEGDRNLVLLAAVPRQAHTDLVLTFPLMTATGQWNTNWPLKLSFPLFLRNVLMSLGNVRAGGSEEAVKPGQVVPLRVGGAGVVTVRKPDGETVRLERGSRADVAFAGTDQLGVFTARWTEPGGGEATRRFAVTLADSLESDIAPASAVTIGAATVTADAPRKVPRDLWKFPVLAGLLVLVAEWWVYNKRVSI
ncbi:MAG: vWA domain-containing protein [Fimbriiglobus sp.]